MSKYSTIRLVQFIAFWTVVVRLGFRSRTVNIDVDCPRPSLFPPVCCSFLNLRQEKENSINQQPFHIIGLNELNLPYRQGWQRRPEKELFREQTTVAAGSWTGGGGTTTCGTLAWLFHCSK